MFCSKSLLSFLFLFILNSGISQVYINGTSGDNRPSLIFKSNGYENFVELYDLHKDSNFVISNNVIKYTDSSLICFSSTTCETRVIEYFTNSRKSRILSKIDQPENIKAYQLLKANGNYYAIGNRPASDNEYEILSFNSLTSQLDIFPFSTDSIGYPCSSLMQASNGLMYFITNKGIVAYNPVSHHLELVYEQLNLSIGFFLSGPLCEHDNLKLYGTKTLPNSESIFYYDVLNDTLVFKLNISSEYPLGLVKSTFDGKLYGTSRNGFGFNGSIYCYNPNSNTIQFIYSDSRFVTAPLVEVGSKIYWTSRPDQFSSNGFIMSYDRLTNLVTSEFELLSSSYGSEVKTVLVSMYNDKLFGLISKNNSNRLFSFDVNTNNFTIEYENSEKSNYAQLNRPLVIAKKEIYNLQINLKNSIPQYQCKLFKIDSLTNEYISVFTLDNVDICSDLTYDGANGLYFFTRSSNNLGTYYKYDIEINQLETLSQFNCDYDITALEYTINHSLIGMKHFSSNRSIFSLDLNTGIETEIYQINHNYGNPVSFKNRHNGNLIGITYELNAAIIFQINPFLNEFEILDEFDNSQNYNTSVDFCLVDDSIIYGMGKFNVYYNNYLDNNSIFKYNLNSNQIEDVVTYSLVDYGFVTGNLIFGSDFKLHGVANGSESTDFGQIMFTYDLQNKDFEYEKISYNCLTSIDYIAEIPFEPSYSGSLNGFDYSIYPNPTSDELTIYTYEEIPQLIEIYNNYGALLGSFNSFIYPFNEIDVSTYNGASFFVKIVFTDGTVVYEPFTKI